jgi:cytochrome b561
MSGESAVSRAWGRGGTVLFALSAGTLALLAAQFALAGFGAFTMLRNRSDQSYQAHIILGLAIAAMTLLILVAVLASKPARAHRPKVWEHFAASAWITC